MQVTQEGLMSPAEGPPLPRSLGIFWPWYRPPEFLREREAPAPAPAFAATAPIIITQAAAPAAAPPVTTVTIVQPPRQVQAAPYVPPAPVTGPKVADIRFEDLRISPSTVQVGRPVEVSILARNIGDGTGSEAVTAELDGQISRDSVTLRPGESKFISFRFSVNEPGTYGIAVNGLRGRLFAEAPAPPVALPPTIPTPEPPKVTLPPVEPPPITPEPKPLEPPLVPSPPVKVPGEPTFTVDTAAVPEDGGYIRLEPEDKFEFKLGEVTSAVAFARSGWSLDYWTVDGLRFPGGRGRYRLPIPAIIRDTSIRAYFKRV